MKYRYTQYGESQNHCVEWTKLEPTYCIIRDFIYVKLQKWQLVCICRKIGVYVWKWVEGGWLKKNTKFGGVKKCLLSWLLWLFHSGDIPKLIKLYTLHMWSLLYVKYTLTKLQKSYLE